MRFDFGAIWWSACPCHPHNKLPSTIVLPRGATSIYAARGKFTPRIIPQLDILTLVYTRSYVNGWVSYDSEWVGHGVFTHFVCNTP